MGAIKHYLNNLVCVAVPEDGHAQDAIENAIRKGWIQIGGVNFAQDLAGILNQKEAILAMPPSQLRNEAGNSSCTDRLEPIDTLITLSP